MKNIRKIATAVTVVAVLLIVALVVLVKVLITPERVRSAILPVAERHLQRDVELGRIEVSLFSGILLEDLVVSDREGIDPFVSTRKAALHYRFWPLLFGRVVIDEILLDGPRVRVLRLPDGRFNFSDLLPKQKTPAETNPVTAEGKSPIDLLISSIKVSGGEIIFFDHALGSGPPFRFQVTDFSLTASDLSLVKAFPFEIGGVINGSDLKMVGELNPKTLEGKLSSSLSDFDLIPFAPYFQHKFPGRLGSLRLGLSLIASGSPSRVNTQGTVTFKNLDLQLDALPKSPIQASELSLAYETEADFEQDLLTVQKAILSYAGAITIQAAGRIEAFSADPRLDLLVEVPPLEVRRAIDSLPPDLMKDVAALDPAGSLSARLRLAGPPSQPLNLLREGSFQLDALQANLGPARPALSGSLKLQADRLVSEGLTLRIGDNQAAIELSAGPLFKKPIVVSHRLVSERFLLDSLLQAGAAGAGSQKSEKPTSSAPAEEVGPYDLPLRLDGRVEIAELLYKGQTMSNFRLEYRLADNALTIDRLSGEIADGRLRGNALVDLAQRGLAYRGELNLDQLQADPVVSAVFPRAAKTVFGTLSLQTAFKGRGTSPAAAKKNLSGQGQITLADGKLSGPGFVQGLADFLRVEQMRELQIKNFQGKLTVSEGQVLVSSELAGDKVRMSPRGTVGLDGTLDLKLQSRFAPELAGKIDRRGAVTQFLTDQEGWVQVPLKVVGSFGKPVFAFDAASVKEQVKERAKGEAQKIFKQLLPEKDETQTEQGKDPGSVLKETLKGILGQ